MSQKPDKWMPLYVGDYLSDTSRLTTEQHGAYLLLLMDYWRNGPPLDDDDELAAITKLSTAQWRKIAPKIRQFFASSDGKLHQSRADKERQKAGLMYDKRSEAGKQGAAKRWGKHDGKGMANAMAPPLPERWQNDGTAIADGMANAMANGMANTWQNDAQPQPQLQPPLNPDPIASAIGSSPCARGFPADPTAEPTAAGLACRAMREAGLADCNPAHPKLDALLSEGITIEELRAAAADAAQRGKRFAYALATAEGRRRDAARTAPLPAHGSSRTNGSAAPKSFAQQDREAGWSRWEQMTGQVHPDRLRNGDVAAVIDVAVKPVPQLEVAP